MSRTFKRKLLALAAIGFMIAAAGYALGGNTATTLVNGRPAPLKSEPQTLRATDQLTFKNLEVTSSVGAVRIIAGSPFSIDASYNGSTEPAYELDGDTLKVYDNVNADFKVTSIGSWLIGDNHIAIVIPDGLELDSVNVTSDVGDVYIYGISAGSLTAHSDVGQLTIEKVTVGEPSPAGSGTTGGEAEVSSNVGDITLTDLIAPKRLTVRGNVGSVTINGELRGETLVSTDVGNIAILPSLPAEMYTFELHSEIGKVLRPTVNSTNGEYLIKASSTVGNISVSSTAE